VSESEPIPQAARPFLGFVTLLRANGFRIAPEQTMAFLAGVGLLGPRDPEDIRQAGLATLAPPPDRRAAYDLLFRVHFLGAEAPALSEADAEEPFTVHDDDRRGELEPPEADEVNETGEAATRAEALAQRRFGAGGANEALRRLQREAPRRLPRRRSYRRVRARRGPVIDLRRTLREAARNDGEVVRLARLTRRRRPRKLLLLIDVSGSMKALTEENLRLAHALMQAQPRLEAFTFGTRLTRLTRAMRLKRREQALQAAAEIVSDFDGGTRIGDALQAFLAVPRFGSYARGAATLIVSDGLERGDPLALADAVAKLKRRSWRLSWLTPLARGKNFRPKTEALIAVSRFVDDMVDGGSTPAIVDHLLALSRKRAA
jgi:uncharacterized protein with von Willebrand factor type A (vWA) domain